MSGKKNNKIELADLRGANLNHLEQSSVKDYGHIWSCNRCCFYEVRRLGKRYPRRSNWRI